MMVAMKPVWSCKPVRNASDLRMVTFLSAFPGAQPCFVGPTIPSMSCARTRVCLVDTFRNTQRTDCQRIVSELHRLRVGECATFVRAMAATARAVQHLSTKECEDTPCCITLRQTEASGNARSCGSTAQLSQKTGSTILDSAPLAVGAVAAGCRFLASANAGAPVVCDVRPLVRCDRYR